MKTDPDEPISDETLMAYADGALCELEARAIEMRLASDPGLMARLEPFRVTRDDLPRAFHQPMQEPIPDRLIATVMEGGVGVRAPFEATMGRGAFVDVFRVWFGTGRTAVSAAAAAVLLLMLVAFGLPSSVDQASTRLSAAKPRTSIDTQDGGVLIRKTSGSLFAAGVLAAALERGPSGPPHIPEAPAGAAVAVPVGSFLANDGRYCREYRAVDRTRGAFAGVACRFTDRARPGTWHVLFHDSLTAARSTANPSKYYAAGRSASAKLDAAVEGMRASDILGAEEEERLIARGWVKD